MKTVKQYYLIEKKFMRDASKIDDLISKDLLEMPYFSESEVLIEPRKNIRGCSFFDDFNTNYPIWVANFSISDLEISQNSENDAFERLFKEKIKWAKFKIEESRKIINK